MLVVLLTTFALDEKLERLNMFPLYVRACGYCMLISLGPGSSFAGFGKHEALSSTLNIRGRARKWKITFTTARTKTVTEQKERRERSTARDGDFETA